jgi:hypothetical protein
MSATRLTWGRYKPGVPFGEADVVREKQDGMCHSKSKPLQSGLNFSRSMTVCADAETRVPVKAP